MYLSTVGFGTSALGGTHWKYSWGPQDDNESIKAIIHAVEKGVNWIDTAAVYGLGHSEIIVGKAIKELPSRPIIATKGGLVWDNNGNISGNLKKESIRTEVERSLQRLGIDVIDLYQIHQPNPVDDIEEAWCTVADCIQEGKIRYAGVSNFTIAQLSSIQKIYPPASLQPPYSMLNREIEKEILGYCAENDIGVIIYRPLQMGLLSGKFTKERIASLPQNDRRSRNPYFQEPQLTITLTLIENLREIAEKNGRTMAQLALSWVLRRCEVTSAIVGARHPLQIEETVDASEWTLSNDDISAIEILLNERLKELEN